MLSVTGVKAVQLHGDEKLADFEFIECPLLKSATLDHLDGDGSRLAGGNHVAARRDRSREARRHRRRSRLDKAAAAARNRKIVLAGGLTPDNVEEAIRTVRPVRRGCGVGRGSVARRQGFREGVARF